MSDKTPISSIEAVTTTWIRSHDLMRILIADGESVLASEEVAQRLDRVNVDLKAKAPGEHAQMVERHHEFLPRFPTRAQLKQEGISVPFSVTIAEAVLAKNTLTTVAGQTPYRALYGRDPRGLAEFEPTSETQLDDR